MRLKFKNLTNKKFLSDDFDPTGSYTGNYMSYDEDDFYPEQDADDL